MSKFFLPQFLLLIAVLGLGSCPRSNIPILSPIYIRNWSQYDVNEVWRVHGGGPNVPLERTLLLQDLSPLAAEGVNYNDERVVLIPLLHDPATNPTPTPYYTLEYIQERVRFNGQPQYHTSPLSTRAFAPGTLHVNGYSIVRETMFIHDYSGFPTSTFEQMLRGPDGNLYLYRPGDQFLGHPEVNNGPILLQTLINEGYGAYSPAQRGP